MGLMKQLLEPLLQSQAHSRAFLGIFSHLKAIPSWNPAVFCSHSCKIWECWWHCWEFLHPHPLISGVSSSSCPGAEWEMSLMEWHHPNPAGIPGFPLWQLLMVLINPRSGAAIFYFIFTFPWFVCFFFFLASRNICPAAGFVLRNQSWFYRFSLCLFRAECKGTNSPAGAWNKLGLTHT